MKVTDLKENECIHCETEEQAEAICKLMHEAGLEWKGGQSYLSKNYYGNYKSETCYFPIDGQYRDWETDRKSTRLNSSHSGESRMPSSA